MQRNLKRTAATALVSLVILQFPAIAGDCVKVGTRCVDATPCKNISGINVCLAGVPLPAGNSISAGADVTCWHIEDAYDCVSPNTVDDCQPLRDRGCGQIGSTCTSSNASTGACTNYQQTYQCQTTPAQTQQVTDCGAKEFCMDGKCFDTVHAPDPDIFKVATAMEAAREAGTYMDPNSLEMFKGSSGSCAKGYFGLKNCCKTSGGGGAYSNAAVFGLAMSAGGQAVKYGSSYAYDALYVSDAPDFMVKGMGALLGVDPVQVSSAVASFSPTLSLYGFTATTGTLAAGVAPLGSAGGITLGFDPTSFAISVGIMVIQELMSCEPQDQVLGIKRGQNLCHFAGSYCSNKMPILGICLETTESYCCFNSKLARIINEQGRPQTGKSWGSGESPNCSGFTPDQFQSLEFNKMDLSEFYAEIMANMKTPDISQASQKVQETVMNKLNYYYGR